ncbi:unnamed protein product [Urochloa decumbens]|uniref:KIB1-4 beta-propeller domain-containing protein n=1 Tax=Urochloa decumbens TaxID=240449 RepID=A0ABC8Z3S6_9POAL
MASKANDSLMPPELEIGSKPLLIMFNGVDRPVLVDPFDGGFREATLELEALQGKECLYCFQGEWLLMFDGGTKECFLVSLISLSRISLPPLLTPLENLYMCALSSPTLPDCTIMFIAERIKYGGDDDDDEEEERYLVYCRPGGEEWWEVDNETDGTYDAMFDKIVGSQGTMYVRTEMNTFVAVNAALSSSSDAYIERRGIQHPSKMRWGGDKYMYAANPFTGDVVELPDLPWLGEQFDGISFSSPPNSPNCIVCSIHKERVSNQAQSNTIYVMVWRTGDKQWTKKKIEDHTEFRTAYSNPIFYHGEFYCLGTRGNLGIFNPNNMTWRVLDKPDPVLVGDPMPGEQYCHLLEFRDDLIAIFRPHDKGPIDLYRLNKSQMVWIKIDRLDDEVVYVDNWNAIMMPAPRDVCCNRIYLPKLGVYDEARDAHNSAFYDLRSRSYYPNYYGLTERMNSIWILPNFRDQ